MDFEHVEPERLLYLFGDEAIAELEHYELADEDDRIELIERYAPLPFDARQRDARMAVRTMVVTQILGDEPPETWQTAKRLDHDGLDREEVLSQLALVGGECLRVALAEQSAFDTGAYRDALAALPLPPTREMEDRIIEVARSKPGIPSAELIETVTRSFDEAAAGVIATMIDRIVDLFLTRGPLQLLVGDLTVVVPDLIDGKTFTHRLNGAEAKREMLNVGFDLGAFSWVDVIRMTGGIELEQFSEGYGHLSWKGPDGWLSRFNPGDLLACTINFALPDNFLDNPLEATVDFRVVEDEPDVNEELVRHVRDTYDELIAEPWLPLSGDYLAWELVFNHPQFFNETQPPMRELCSAAGLELRGSLVAHDESIWRADLALRRFRAISDNVPDSLRLILGDAIEVLDDPDATPEAVRKSLDECAEPDTLETLANALFEHYLDLSDEFELGTANAPGRLFELVNRAAAVARRPREIATARFLACVLYERCGAPDVAEEHLRQAREAQPSLGPIAERLGWYCFDRGDAKGAKKWWQRLDEPPQGLRTIEPFLDPASAQPKVGRNEPCWCGSGRKFKQCHQGKNELAPLPDRVGWLCRKATTWFEHSADDVRQNVVDLAAAFALDDPDDDSSDATSLDALDEEMFGRIIDALDDPIVIDAALTEGGFFSLFLHERGPLLPEDEQLLAASWLTVERSVHEVVEVEPGVGMALRNLATGDVANVREHTASTQAQIGELYCARVVPDGASNQIIGGVFAVRTGQEAAVLDLCDANDPLALCAWAGAVSRVPTIVPAPGLIDSMFDRDTIDTLLANQDDAGPEETIAELQSELRRQAQNTWLDENIPALDGLTPREAAADPTRRDQLERLLNEFDRPRDLSGLPDGFQAFTYDVDALRRELGL